MIEVLNLTKVYGDVAAVDNISFSIQKGEIIGLIGPNGAGKTTTIKMLTCYLTPTSGKITIAGLDVAKDSLAIRKKLGYLSENAPVYEDMSVTEYLQLVAEVHNIPKKEIPAKIQRVVELCGLRGREHQDIKELSKGYHQRVGLAQSLVHDPEILILDEPTTGLDPNQRIEIRDLIKQIGREKTVILSSHILSEVEATCDRVMIIHRGKLMAVGTTAELRDTAEQKSNIYLKLESTSEKACALKVFQNRK